MIRKIKVFFIILVIISVKLYSEGLTGADVLLIQPSASSTALGEGGTGRFSGLDSVGINPAGLCSVSMRRILFSHIEWLSDLKYDSIFYSQPLLKGGFFASFSYFNQPDFDNFNLDGLKEGTLNASDFLFQSGYGYMWGKLAAGTILKIINRNLSKYSSLSFALDFGMLLKTRFIKLYKNYEDNNLSLGVSFQNFGTGVKFVNKSFPLPLTLRGGVNYKIFQNEKHSLDILSDFKVLPMDKITGFSGGLEYGFKNKGFIRFGFSSSVNTPTRFYFGLGGRHLYRKALLGLDITVFPDPIFGTNWIWNMGVEF